MSLADEPAAPRASAAPPPWRVDAINAAVALAIGLALIALGASATGGLPQLVPFSSSWWHAVPLALTCGAILWQSKWPMAAFGIASALLAVDVLMGLNAAVVLAWSNTAYAVYRHASRTQRRAVTFGTIFALVVLAPALLLAGADSAAAVIASLQIGAFAAVAAWWGGDVRSGHELAAVERARAVDIQRLGQLEQAAAVRAARAAMSRDLHDIISSRISAVALHSAAALQLEPDTDRDRRVLGDVRAESVAALDEMRRLIHLLRTDGDSDDGLALGDAGDFDADVERFRTAGLDVEAHVDASGIDPETGRALLLIAREALTNALKHGEGSARLQLNVAGDDAVLVVENAAPRARAGRASAIETGSDKPGAGVGLGTMRERAAALDGTVDVRLVERGDGCTWTVTARIPNRAAREESA